MKTGAIVYVIGGEDPYDDLDMELAVRELDIHADRVEVVSARSGHFDVMDAWWLLMAKGMKSVVCMLAEVVNRSEIRLTGRELRLFG